MRWNRNLWPTAQILMGSHEPIAGMVDIFPRILVHNANKYPKALQVRRFACVCHYGASYVCGYGCLRKDYLASAGICCSRMGAQHLRIIASEFNLVGWR